MAVVTVTFAADPNVAEVESAPIEVVQPSVVVNEEPFTIDEQLVAQEDVVIDKTIQSITFKKDMAITDALTFLQHRYRKNIVWTAGVQGSITVGTLYDVTFEQALDAILSYGFKYIEEGNFIKVYTDEEFKAIREDTNRMVHRVFHLYYIAAAEIKTLIVPVLSENGKIESTSPASVDFSATDSISTTAGGGDTVAVQDTIVVSDYPENIAKVEEIIEAVDIKPKQVLIEATILSATLTEGIELGIDWKTLHGSVITQLADLSRGAPDFLGFAGTSIGDSAVGDGGLTVGFAHDNVAGIVTALEEISDITILANPKLLAVNKQLGQVYIGQKIAYISSTTVTETGTTQEVSFLDTGTKLSFRPYIGNDGYVRMDIHPKDSSGTLRTIATGTDAPDETSAELVTNIVVKDGETVVIGGMFRDKAESKRGQVPILGEIPLAGALFRDTADSLRREEVVVMLTPHIIEDPSETNGDDRAAEAQRKRLGMRDNMPLVCRTRLAHDSYSRAARLYSNGNSKKALSELNWTLYLRPTYFEASRLKERIVREMSPADVGQIERIMLKVIEDEDAHNWQRR